MRRRERVSRGVLAEFATTYSYTRVFLGIGLIALTGVLVLTGDVIAHLWVVAAAGGVILLHSLAMRLWGIEHTLSALLIDLTTSLTAAAITTSSEDHSEILMALIGSSALIALFTEGWIRYAIIGYAITFSAVALLLIEEGKIGSVASAISAAVFVVALIVGVVSAMRRRLLEIDAARAQTIGVVSHELRNYLTGVIGITELVGDDQASLEPGEVEELLELAHQQAVEAGEVIEDLLVASRAERGVLDAMPELVDLCPLTQTVIRRTSVEGAEIGFHCYGGAVWAMADPLRYKQILRNLLTNALRYGGNNIRVSVESFDHTVSVVVADDGDGVDPEYQPAMFQPYRAGMAMSKASGSSGLGLWIARGLAHKMGGNVRYRREAGLTVFELVLPSAEAPPKESELAELAATSTLDLL